MRNFGVIFLTFFLLNSSSLLGQKQISNSKIMFGVKAGLNVSNLIQNSNSMNPITGFYFAGVVEFKISDVFAIEPEFGYSGQGADLKGYFSGFNSNVSGRYRLEYFNIPVMAKYYFWKGLCVEAGPQIGFLSSASFVGDIESNGEMQHADSNVKDFFKKTDFGVNLGLGYTTKQGGFLGARFNSGLTDAFKNNPNKPVMNSVLQFYLGYKL